MTTHMQGEHDPTRSPGDLVQDPVCGMDVDPNTTEHRSEHGGLAFYFCSAGCKARFDDNPSQYVGAPGALSPNANVAEGDAVEFTCPMHPEIRQSGPGPCPICGMALEPVVVTAGACALGLATPMSIMVGVGRGAGLGVLIKNAEALERLEKVDTLVVDKTGTLTEGRPSVTQIVPANGFEENELLRLAAGVERASEHPLGLAIVEAADKAGLQIPDVTEFDSPVGKGVFGTVEGKRVVLGSATFLSSEDVDVSPLAAQADELRKDGATAIFVGVNGQLAAVFAIADPVKETTSAALAALREDGIRVVMLTGDNRITAEAVARRLGIDGIEAEVLPDRKSGVIERLRGEGRVVAMAGDGVNDAPALAAADVGIAMGTGTDVAIESAGVTLLKGDVTGIVRARKLSEATMSNIRQNLVFAFIYNAAGIPVAAGILYPFFGTLLSPIIAAAAMALSSVSVIGNALRLRTQKL